MTTYRAGQRVRIEGDGWAVEGILAAHPSGRLYVDLPGDEYEWPMGYWGSADRATVTILSEPRPEEPTGLGAVVEAELTEGPRRRWMRDFDGTWIEEFASTRAKWGRLVDPVVLHEGWTP